MMEPPPILSIVYTLFSFGTSENPFTIHIFAPISFGIFARHIFFYILRTDQKEMLKDDVGNHLPKVQRAHATSTRSAKHKGFYIANISFPTVPKRNNVNVLRQVSFHLAEAEHSSRYTDNSQCCEC